MKGIVELHFNYKNMINNELFKASGRKEISPPIFVPFGNIG
jgi:hypothetical protein